MNGRIDEAIVSLRDQFPFKGYTDNKSEMYKDIARTVLRHMTPPATILDFGCGPLDKTLILQHLGFVCSAYDDLQDHWHRIGSNIQKIESFAKETGIDFRLAADDQLPFSKGHFDMIMLQEVLEHLHNSPKDLLLDLLDLAKPGGLLYVTVPNAVNIRKRLYVLLGKTNYPDYESFYWYPGPWRGHVREYVKDDLIKLAGFLDLEIVQLTTTHYMLGRLPSAVVPIYKLATRLAPGCRDTWSMVARKRANWTPRRNLPTNDLLKMLSKYGSFRPDDAVDQE